MAWQWEKRLMQRGEKQGQKPDRVSVDNESFTHYFQYWNTSVSQLQIKKLLWLLFNLTRTATLHHWLYLSMIKMPEYNNIIIIRFIISVWHFLMTQNISNFLFFQLAACLQFHTGSQMLCVCVCVCVCVWVWLDLLSDLVQNRSRTQQMSVSNYCWFLVWEETETNTETLFLATTTTTTTKVKNNSVKIIQSTHQFASLCIKVANTIGADGVLTPER